MEWNTVQSRWNELKDELRSVWNRLSEMDLSQVHGDRNRLLSVIQQKYGIGLKAAEEQLQQFLSSDKTGTGLMKAAGTQAAEKAKEFVQPVIDRGQEYLEKGRDYFQETPTSQVIGDIKGLITRNPIPGALVALGVGFLLSRMLTPSGRS